MTTWDEEKTPIVPHSIPYRAPVVMPGLQARLSVPGTVRSTTPHGLGPGAPHSTLAPLGPNPHPEGGSRATVSPVSSKQGPPPLPPRPLRGPSPEGLPSAQRLLRTWDRLTPENRRLVETLALALLPPAEDVSRR